jgi:hypothetical protein
MPVVRRSSAKIGGSSVSSSLTEEPRQIEAETESWTSDTDRMIRRGSMLSEYYDAEEELRDEEAGLAIQTDFHEADGKEVVLETPTEAAEMELFEEIFQVDGFEGEGEMTGFFGDD